MSDIWSQSYGINSHDSASWEPARVAKESLLTCHYKISVLPTSSGADACNLGMPALSYKME